MSFLSAFILIALGFVIAVWLVFTIIMVIQRKKYEKKREAFLKRNMKPKAYLRFQEIESASLWRIIWNKV